MRALGTRHCFNDIADSSGVLASTANLTRIWPVDVPANTVTVESGVTYGMLCPVLDQQGYALRNLASLPHITIAGACATATHGSGETNQNLAAAASRIELIKADGSLVTYSRGQDADTFCALVVGLGCLGIISSITLDVVPRFDVSQHVYLDLPFEQAIEHFDEIQTLGYSVSLFTDWRHDLINQVWLKRRAADDPPPFTDVFGAAAAHKKVHPIAALDPTPCTEQLGVAGVWYERLPHFKLAFTPSAAVELQTEYFVPRLRAVEALQAINSLSDEIAPLLQVSEIRTIAPDDLWMSPCYKQACVGIHFTWFQKQPEVEALLPRIEQALSPFEARPHWGKLYAMRAEQISSLYPRLPDFLQIATEFDPTGKFWNAYLARCFGER